MSSVTATVEDVLVKETASGKTVYIVKAGGMELSTLSRELAQDAKDSKGDEVQLEYTEKQNGRYTNRYLERIRPPESDGFTKVQASIAGADKELRIMRQTAAKVATAQLVYFPATEQTQATLQQLTEMWVSYFVNGWPEGEGEAPPPDDGIPF